jgi:uncharacterized protein (DUF305 family)
MRGTLIRSLSAAGLLGWLAGCAPSTPAPAPAPAVAPAPVPPVTTNPEAMARARADSARRPYTRADVDFMSHMISHHAQAIDMSRWAPTHGASPSVQRLASRIINAQQDEIVLMQRWLADRGLPVPEAKAVKMTHVMDGMVHEMTMPGMLTDEQMRELDAARGPDFDRLFLSRMIAHHQGAVGMVDALFESYGAGQNDTVFKLASDIQVDQRTEVQRMQQMLVQLEIERRSQ